MTTSNQAGRRRSVAIATAAVLGASLAIVPGVSASSGSSGMCRVTNVSTGATYGDAYIAGDLQLAIDEAGQGQTLQVSGVCYGGFFIYDDLTIIGGTLDGSRTERVLYIGADLDPDNVGKPRAAFHSDVDVTLRRVTIRNGFVGPDPDDTDDLYAGGAGIYVDDDADVRLIDSTVTGNEADEDGGGIHVDGDDTEVGIAPDADLSDTSLVVVGGRITNNITDDDGGGIGATDDDVQIDITKTRLSGNRAGDDGGAISVEDYSTISLTSAYLEGNTAYSDGGAIEMDDDNTLLVFSSKLQKNTVNGDGLDSDGGAIYADEDNFLRFWGASTVAYNVAGGDGGGIRAEESEVILEGTTTVRKNRAGGDGGGIDIDQGDRLVLNDRVRVEYNTSGGDGGGVDLDGCAVLVHMNVLSVVRNNAAGGEGGGVIARDDADLVNVTPANVFANTPDQVYEIGGGC